MTRKKWSCEARLFLVAVDCFVRHIFLQYFSISQKVNEMFFDPLKVFPVMIICVLLQVLISGFRQTGEHMLPRQTTRFKGFWNDSNAEIPCMGTGVKIALA